MIWLIGVTLLEGVMALLLVGAIVMSPMMFTSEEAFRDPTKWLLILILFVLMGLLGTVTALQWYFFSAKKTTRRFPHFLSARARGGVFGAVGIGGDAGVAVDGWAAGGRDWA